MNNRCLWCCNAISNRRLSAFLVTLPKSLQITPKSQFQRKRPKISHKTCKSARGMKYLCIIKKKKLFTYRKCSKTRSARTWNIVICLWSIFYNISHSCSLECNAYGHKKIVYVLASYGKRKPKGGAERWALRLNWRVKIWCRIFYNFLLFYFGFSWIWWKVSSFWHFAFSESISI